MAAYSPRRVRISAGEESTYGSAAGTLDIWLGLINPFEATKKNNLLKLEGLREGLEIPGYADNYESINFTLNINGFTSARFLKYTMGQVSTSGSGPYVHTITALNDAYHPSITIEVAKFGTTDKVKRYLGCVFGNTTIKWSKGEIVKATVDVIAKSIENDTTANGTATEPTDVESKIYSYRHATLKISGTEVVHREGTYSIKKEVTAEPRIDSSNVGYITRPYVGPIEHTLEFVVDLGAYDLDSLTGYNSIEVKFTNGSNYLKVTGDAKIEEIGEPIDLGNNIILQRVMAYMKNVQIEAQEDDAW